MLLYELWIDREGGPNTPALVVLAGVTDDGQKTIIDSESFGPFDDDSDIANWVWYRLRHLPPVV